MNIRFFALASASVLALGVVGAQAADLTYEPAPVAAAAPAAFNWTGFYLGVHAGAAITDFDFSLTEGGLGFSNDNTGFLGGVQAGYNWQFDNIVLGLQTDFAYTSAKTSFGGDDTNSAEQKLEWLGSTTARIGYAFDNLLVYGKGGVAYGRSTFDVPYTGGLSLQDSQWHTGWTAGAGVEYAFTQNITGLLEYNYTDLGSQDYLGNTMRVDLTSNVIKAGLNYKF
ncbi:porin family protein [Kaistia defluvii]|uniref:outer membrane protein n=1 Tax=Kaistia defluvii TaxID=410841 RepID=UPI00224D3E9A|nr:outer membrane protein [Kaistia defluvii]MCX5520068.1 porin family protein [Kaistia defluvii]